jgi:hypothetical protein
MNQGLAVRHAARSVPQVVPLAWIWQLLDKRVAAVWLLALPRLANATTDGECSGWLAASQVADLEETALSEVSGMAASHQYPGVFWAHNDRGGSPTLYALDEAGTHLGTWSLLGATLTDWEDMALGPCPDGLSDACSCLYIGDFGDNDQTRDDAVIWRLVEPDVSDALAGETGLNRQASVLDGLRFTFSDGAHDVEAMAVHPQTGEILLITKDERPGVWTLPADATGTVDATRIGTLDLEDYDLESEEPTSADLSPWGTRLALRTDEDILFLQGDGTFTSLLSATGVRLPAPAGLTGEAVTWDIDGDRLWGIDEGVGAPLWEVSCVAFEPGEGDTSDPLVDCATPSDSGDDTGTPPVDPSCGCRGSRAAGVLLLALPIGAWSRRRASPKRRQGAR